MRAREIGHDKTPSRRITRRKVEANSAATRRTAHW